MSQICVIICMQCITMYKCEKKAGAAALKQAAETKHN